MELFTPVTSDETQKHALCSVVYIRTVSGPRGNGSGPEGLVIRGRKAERVGAQATTPRTPMRLRNILCSLVFFMDCFWASRQRQWSGGLVTLGRMKERKSGCPYQHTQDTR